MGSRRQFVTGTLSTAAAAALGAGAVATEAQTDAVATGKRAHGTEYDVIVVGGGLSGVSAARDCSRNGLKTLLLEARDRLGGRAHDTHFGGSHVELGGTWVHWTQPFIWSEILRYGLTIEDTPGAVPDRFVALIDGARTEFAKADRIEEIAAGWMAYFEESRVVWERPYDAGFRWPEIVQADKLTAADRLRQVDLTAFQRGILTPTFEAMVHCPIEHASYVELLRRNALAMHDLATVFDAGMRYKIKEGTGELVRRIAADGNAEVRLSTPVRAIAHQEGAVVVTPHGCVPARRRGARLQEPCMGKRSMGHNFRLFCIVDGGIGIVFALGLLAAPVTLIQLLGIQPDSPAIVFARAAGAILLGCGLLMVAFRNSTPSTELVAFLRCLGLGDFLLGVVFLFATASGVMNQLGYGLAALCIGAALVFFLSVRVAAVPSHA